MLRMFVLRPEPGASATVERAHKLGLQAIAVPLFEIEAVCWTSPGTAGFDGLLLTSANAVRFAGEKLREFRGLKAYAVGETTADAARDAGFDIAATGDAGIERLLGSIDGELRLIHVCGENRKETRGARQAITPLVVYRSKLVDGPDLHGICGNVALIHSPRAGQRLAELVSERQTIVLAAISTAAAEAAGSGWKFSEAACEPSEEALLALAARLCNNSPPE